MKGSDKGKSPHRPPAGYSGTPLAKKLGIKAGYRVGLLDVPDDFPELLAPLPPDVVLLAQPRQPVDVVVAFATTGRALARFLDRAPRLLHADGGFWIGWPKKSSGMATELDFNAVQRAGLERGLVDNKVCAIDPTWSGLRFVVRREDRADWAGSQG